jgi:hypothetical protein
VSVETTNFHGNEQDRSRADIVVLQSKNHTGLCDLFGRGQYAESMSRSDVACDREGDSTARAGSSNAHTGG